MFSYLVLIFLIIFPKALLASEEEVVRQQAVENADTTGDSNCRSLGIGKSKSIALSASKSPTTVGMSYTLSHPSKNLYKVQFNINFFVEAAFDKLGWNVSAQKKQTMKKRVQACMKEMNKGMLGPEGQRLELELTEDAAVPKTDIEINCTDPKFRTNARVYPEKESCTAIAHELLHLTGLVDEYEEQEKLSSGASKYNCRAVVVGNSIMHTQQTAFEASNRAREITVETCSSIEATKKWNPLTDKRCPKGSRYWKGKMRIPSTTDWLAKNSEEKMCIMRKTAFDFAAGLGNCSNGDNACHKFKENAEIGIVLEAGAPVLTDETSIDNPDGDLFVMSGSDTLHFGCANALEQKAMANKIQILSYSMERINSSAKSLLHPAHFRAIVNPLCESKNHNYYLCAKRSYVSATQCSPLPDVCKYDRWLQ